MQGGRAKRRSEMSLGQGNQMSAGMSIDKLFGDVSILTAGGSRVSREPEKQRRHQNRATDSDGTPLVPAAMLEALTPGCMASIRSSHRMPLPVEVLNSNHYFL